MIAAAVLFCESCEKTLCEYCDKETHDDYFEKYVFQIERKGFIRKHNHTVIPLDPVMCTRCKVKPSVVDCPECNRTFCECCDLAVHQQHTHCKHVRSTLKIGKKLGHSLCSKIIYA